tara:strand:- start:205 stop:378 length:174 start_codon:yes stop_codon:yes gene_type:complete
VAELVYPPEIFVLDPEVLFCVVSAKANTVYKVNNNVIIRVFIGVKYLLRLFFHNNKI